MIHLIADERHACAHAHGELTVGSRGIPVQVGLSDDFDGLAVTICFQAGTERAEVVWYEGEEINVPPQCLTKEGERLLVGVYGAKADGTVVIPTIWATAGIVKSGTDLTGASPLDPEPDWTAQVQSIAAEAIETANAVKAAADAGEFDGYSPSASVTKSGDTATITITDKDGTTTASIRDGYDTSGSVVQDGTTAIITLTDHDGTTRAEVHDGISPSASVTQTETGATVTVTDRSGTTTAQLTNGEGGLSIVLGASSIEIPCHSSGNAKGGTVVVPFTAFKGSERVACSAAVYRVPSGVTCTITDGTVSNQGELTFALPYDGPVGGYTLYGTITVDITCDGSTMRRLLPWYAIIDGQTGPQGERGPKGDTGDGGLTLDYGSGIILVQCDSDGMTKAYGGGFEVHAYVGAEQRPCTVTINFAPSWLTISVSYNQSGTPVVRYSWQQGQAASNATVGMTIATTYADGTEVTAYRSLNVVTVLDGADGYSPTVTVQPITGGHEVTVTDAGGSQSFDVMDGRDGGQRITKTLSGTIVTASDAYAAPPIDAVIYGASTQDGTPTPSTPVPIESVDALTLMLAGRNLLDVSTEVKGKYITSIGIAATSADWTHSAFIPVVAGQTYTFTPNSSAGNSSKGAWYADANAASFIESFSSGPITVTAPDNARYVRVSYRAASQDVQLEAGGAATAYKPYVAPASIPIDLQGHELRGLPDGTRDELTLTPDGTAYRVTLTQRVGVTTTAATDGITGTVGVDVMSTTGEIADGPTVTYPLATEQTIDLGTVALPANPAPDMTAWADGGSATPSLSLTYERDLGIVIANLEAAIADLATS